MGRALRPAVRPAVRPAGAALPVLALCALAVGPAATGAPREPRQEPVEAPAPEDAPLDGLPLPAPEELEPPDVAGTWEPIESFEGVPVRTVVVQPEGVLEQTYTVRAGGDGTPVSHGPDWTYFANGHPQLQQVWVDGALTGPYRAWQESGQLRVKGQLVDGEREGVWLRYKAGQLLERFEYADGRPHGAFHAWHRSGVPREETHWEHGAQVGRERRWNAAGRPVLEAHWMDGVRHGRYWEGYPLDGAPKLEGAYEHGLRTGTWRRWEKDGTLVLEESYRADELHGLQRTWRSDGSPESEIEFAAGVRHGGVVAWYPSGQKQMEGAMAHGQRDGRWTYWNADGSLNAEWTGVYRDDQKVSD